MFREASKTGRRLTLVAALLTMPYKATPQDLDPAFDGYEMFSVEQLPVTRAQSILFILAGVLGSPEEPLPARLLTLTVTGDGDGLIVEAETRGYLDDAIIGENFKAQFAPDGAQWQIVRLGRQSVCARGEQVGLPGERCP